MHFLTLEQPSPPLSQEREQEDRIRLNATVFIVDHGGRKFVMDMLSPPRKALQARNSIRAKC